MAKRRKYSEFKGEDLPHESQDYDIYRPTLLPNSSKDNELQSLLIHLELGKEKVDFILENGHKFIDKPKVLAIKVNIGLAKAEKITDALRNSNRKNIDSLTDEISEKIQECMKDNPGIVNASDIALLTDIEQEIVAAYLESKPLNEGQKRTISELYKSDFSVSDIHDSLGISMKKIQDHLDDTMLLFAGREGKKVLKIIFKYTKKVPITKLIDNIRNNDLKLQDQLVCKLCRKNELEYLEIFQYLKKFKETENFCQINTTLTIANIIYINESSLDVEQLSIKFNKVETVIRDYLESYKPHELEERHYKNSQLQRIETLITLFGRETKAFLAYRMIISDSIESMILRAESIKRNDPNHPMKVFEELLPLTFYYLKCSLPFDDITRIIAKTCRITLTTHEIFHIIFQLSDPILKGFCIEHYSFSNPVPLYYPKFPAYTIRESKIEFEICSELWYSIQTYHGLISFGIGRAGWNPIGKSHLLDLIFETDFERGNPRKSAFHLNSIDIQMTKNLFAEVGDRHCKESTKLAYIDCHGYSDMSVINAICQYLDVALIHVSHFDFINHREKIMEDIHTFNYIKHVYICIRDYEGEDVILQTDKRRTYIYIPNLVKIDNTIFYSKLKSIGFDILHFKSREIGTEFIEKLMNFFGSQNLKGIQSDNKQIQNMMELIMKNKKSLENLDFSFLNYYPHFIDYMNSFYLKSNETDREIICKHNAKCVSLKYQLDNIKMGEIVQCFNNILEKKNSVLILWKLSQELSVLTSEIISRSEGLISKPDKKSMKYRNDKYNLEIIWREALLSQKYGEKSKCKIQAKYREKFTENFSNFIERGEAFELIDGDNLRYFNQDINALLSKLYIKQEEELKRINKHCKKIKMRQAPIVLSIFGPQSSGKSTLLNYCFGCKFLTSAGRCTRGIYGSLAKLSRPVNCTNQFLILDTEGLDAIERGEETDASLVHFDRTMVLFCLAVSQVVIINVKGDIGKEMQNLLQICAYSLHKLKVSKVVAPKIFFVLNQQADPDTTKHLSAINTLMDKLNKESDLMEIEGIRISDLIQVSRDNLFILPSAFNSQQMNKPAANLFNSSVVKQSPTNAFAIRCAELRLAIIDELIKLPQDERAPFKTMSEWMEMSGVIWDIIVKYQDIVKFRNIEELMCNNKLGKIVTDLMKKYISANRSKFVDITEQLILEIKEIKKLFRQANVLEDYMLKFDQIFGEYQEASFKEYKTICQNDKLLNKMNHICEAEKSNLSRLMYIERKHYKDKLQRSIKASWTNLKLPEIMGNFQSEIEKNVDKYMESSVKELEKEFEEIWLKCFENEDKEEENERDEDFDNLYSIFKMESKTMENKQTIFELFEKSNFEMDTVIKYLRKDMLSRLENYVDSFSGEEDFIFPWKDNPIPIKDMVPFTGKEKCEYLSKESLYTMEKRSYIGLHPVPKINKWISEDCHGVIQYCSGYYNHADITWKIEERKQILRLSSVLKDPDNHKVSTWSKLLYTISSDIESLLKGDPQIPKSTVREMIHYLCSTFRLVNYEINYILAKLTNKAERTITTFAFAYAFKHLLETKRYSKDEYDAEKNFKKLELLDFFLKKVESRKLARGNWDRPKMREIDRIFSNRFALDFLKSVRQGVIDDQDEFIESEFLHRKANLSHKSMLLLIEDIISKEIKLHPKKEVLDLNNNVIQFICNRNEITKKLFKTRWEEVAEEVYVKIVRHTKRIFSEQLSRIKNVISNLLENLLKNSDEGLGFDSDSNFEVSDKTDRKKFTDTEIKESPCRAMVLYLEKYFDSKLTKEDLFTYFNHDFSIKGVKMIKIQKNWVLCGKSDDDTLVLEEHIFNKLTNTKMFNHTEKLFNIYGYLKEFLSTLNCFEYELSKIQFGEFELVKKLKDEYEASVLSCPEKCPSCGKLCERELHPHSGKCRIKTGHQICSMGGTVWKNDENRSAILYTCDDYKDSTEVKIPGRKMNWGEFKEQSGNEWDWTLPTDKDYTILQQNNREKMKNIWNKFGKGILKYHANRGTQIEFIPYTSFDEILKAFQTFKFRICFVIDGTGSMRSDIDKARVSVGQLISKYKEQGHGAMFSIVIYRDHCDNDDLIQKFPVESEFTNNHESVQIFLQGVKVFGGGDGPEAVLDGLATAVKGCNWDGKSGTRNIIIHIFDAPPHGAFPNYKLHSNGSNKGNCCCCNHGGLCKFDWKKDVWDKMRKANIEYHGISTGIQLPHFEKTMKDNLGRLFRDVQAVEKEMVNEAVVQIFIDYNVP